MWGGTIYKSKGKFTDHFDVVNIFEDGIQNMVEVTIVFDTSDKQYRYYFDADKFQADKSWIGKEILKQMKG